MPQILQKVFQYILLRVVFNLKLKDIFDKVAVILIGTLIYLL